MYSIGSATTYFRSFRNMMVQLSVCRRYIHITHIITFYLTYNHLLRLRNKRRTALRFMCYFRTSILYFALIRWASPKGHEVALRSNCQCWEDAHINTPGGDHFGILLVFRIWSGIRSERSLSTFLLRQLDHLFCELEYKKICSRQFPTTFQSSSFPEVLEYDHYKKSRSSRMNIM